MGIFSRIRYYLLGYKNTVSIPDAAKILKFIDVDIYSIDTKVYLTTKDIGESIELLEHICSIDYNTEYAIPTSIKLQRPTDIFLSRWVSIDEKMIEKSIFLKWMDLSVDVYAKFVSGLKSRHDSRRYMNSVKIKPIIKDSEVVMNEYLRLLEHKKSYV